MASAREYRHPRHMKGEIDELTETLKDLEKRAKQGRAQLQNVERAHAETAEKTQRANLELVQLVALLKQLARERAQENANDTSAHVETKTKDLFTVKGVPSNPNKHSQSTKSVNAAADAVKIDNVDRYLQETFAELQVDPASRGVRAVLTTPAKSPSRSMPLPDSKTQASTRSMMSTTSSALGD